MTKLSSGKTFAVSTAFDSVINLLAFKVKDSFYIVGSQKLTYWNCICTERYRQILMTISHGFMNWKYDLTTTILCVRVLYYA